LVAIGSADTRHGPSYRQGRITFGIIVHGDSTVSGHGPGVMPLLTGSCQRLQPLYDGGANFAALFNLRSLPPAQVYSPLVNPSGITPRSREVYVGRT